MREYAMIADGERAALIGPHGDVAWMCVPRWDSEAVFSSLIGGGGRFAVTPVGSRYVWGGSYEDGTLIWTSRWVTTDGIVECREALAQPADEHRAVLLRRLRAVSGLATMNVVLEVGAGFGRHGMTRLKCEDGVWTGRSGNLYLRLAGASEATVHGGALHLHLDLPAGTDHDLVLELADQPLASAPVAVDAAWSGTERSWKDSVPQLLDTTAPDDARQSYAVLRGMTGTSGAMVAAATLGLPERAQEQRNYDYRYAWIRDQCYAGQAIAACGPYPLLDDAVRFITSRLLDDGPSLKPAYSVTGGRVPDEADLNLVGYPGGSARTGNWVNNQFQLDTFGETLLLFAAAASHDRLDLQNWRAAEAAVQAIIDRWQEPDAGIWELNNDTWAHSRLICAAGLRAVAAHAPAAQGAQWTSLADNIVADTARSCLHPSGRWQRSPSDDRVDAALLLPTLRGAIPIHDPRSLATVAAVRADLGREGYVYRFSQDARPLAQTEGAFLLCGFNMAMAVHQQGDETEAMHWFERNRAACSTTGLFTEEYDVEQRQLRGNFPQAFVHAAMLETAGRLATPPAPDDRA
ncbi:glycoside hydrolase family 15 protein [Sanguibacter gelidistatuariae]|uniref:glycoside hydrolase family 15 protein n=1 Tax=Sanguibacter gelidistatuariae TaxID=1814289 RepID=UPI001C31A018|nr:glycoside hydrolase family 15 protein [Sanguibacter gelidistatuariae]